MKQLLLILALVSTCWAQINNGGGGGGTNTVGSGPQNTWQVQTTSCGSNTSCTQINGDGKYVVDASTTLNSSTITCPNSDCNFVAGDVGKVAWVTAQGSSSNAGQYSAGALICPLSTISTVNSAQSITLTAATDCTGTAQTATGILVWGHKDGATLHAMTPGCATVYLPSNVNIILDRGFMTSPATCAYPNGAAVATGIPQASLIGQTSNTQLIMTPDFTWSDCTGSGSVSGGVCIGSAASQIWQVVVWGTGGTSASNSNCANGAGKVVMAPAFGALYFVNLSGICPGTNLVGVELNQPDEQWKEGGAQNVGLTACVVSAKSVYTENLDCHNFAVTNGVGLHVTSTGQEIDTGTFCFGSVLLDGSLTSRNAHFAAGSGSVGGAADAITVDSGGQWRSDGDYVNQDACGGTTAVGLLINSGGKGASRNTVYGSSGGANVAISNGGTFVSDGANTVSGGAVQADFVTISGWDVPTGSCTGTATSSTTLGIQLGGPNTPCTSTTVNVGTTLSRAGTVLSLAVNCGTGGVSASSGVFTVNKTTNGTTTQTTSTCTVGTGTTCKDFTHQPAFAIGDILSVQFTTQGSETLANCKVNVVAW